MVKTQMVTFWDIEIPDMDREQLETELRVQRWLHRVISRARAIQEYKDRQTAKVSWVRMNKIDFSEIYLKQLEGLIAEIEYYIPFASYPKDYDKVKSNAKKREEIAERKKAQYNKRNTGNAEKVSAEREGISLQWDKDKFLLVARDRGYRTEEAVLAVVSQELAVNYNKAKIIVDGGRFTWGQVLVLGAVFEMTPKEFCDIFMSGYFIEEFGMYRASDANIDKMYLTRMGRYLPERGQNANDGSQTEENADEDKSLGQE